MPPNTFQISGLVYDVNGSTPLVGATVRVTNFNTGQLLSDTTQLDGSFSVTFTSFSDNDFIFVEVLKSISSSEERLGLETTTIDTALAGRDLSITTNKILNRTVERVPWNIPKDDREMSVFDSNLRANRNVRVIGPQGDGTVTRDANSYITTIEETDGGVTLKTDFTRDANNFVTSWKARFI